MGHQISHQGTPQTMSTANEAYHRKSITRKKTSKKMSALRAGKSLKSMKNH